MVTSALVFFALTVAALALSVYERLRDGRLTGDATDAETIDWVRRRAAFLSPVVMEVPVVAGTCAYCENKTSIVLRVRDSAGKPFAKEDLLFVFVHELAHVLSDAEREEHGPLFLSAFAALRARAVAAGLFPEDHDVPNAYTEGC